jgi:hypothetical protein
MVAPTSMTATDRILGHRQLIGNQLEGVFHRKRLDIDGFGGQTPEIEGSNPQIDVFRA